MSLLAYVSYKTRDVVSVHFHHTHTETSNLSTRLWHYMAKSSFSKVINQEATKVPYTFRNVLIMIMIEIRVKALPVNPIDT